MADAQDMMLKRILDEVLDGRKRIEERLDEVQEKADSFRNETLSNFDGTFQQLQTLASEVRAISAGLGRVEQTIQSEESVRQAIRRDVEALKERLARLERRLDEMEPGAGDLH